MYANARLTPEGRRILVERIASGRPAAHVAAEMGVSRTTAHRWWRRYQDEGVEGPGQWRLVLEHRSGLLSCSRRTIDSAATRFT